MEADFPRKLGLKPGHRVYLLHGLPGFADELAAATPAVTLTGSAGQEPVDLAVAWPENDIGAMFRELLPHLKQDGAIWLVIPKKSSGAPGPSFQSALDAALPLGLVDNKVLSFSATEYGIRFVIRRELRR